MFLALRRVIAPLGVGLQHAASAAAALALVERFDAQLLITDMRIADALVADLLRQASRIRPGIRKLILTGFADQEQTISAINEGKINRYFTKPWINEELRAAIADELKLYAQQQQVTARQSALVRHAAEADRKMIVTSQLFAKSTDLLKSVRHETAIDLFQRLLGGRLPKMLRFSQDVARLAKALAEDAGLDAGTVEQVRVAAALHQIGLLSLPFSVRDLRQMSAEQLQEYRQYPVIGADAIQGDTEVDEVATIIRCHREDFNGDGYPTRLVGQFIHVGARIIRLLIDYQAVYLRNGDAAAVRVLQAGAGTRYDPVLVQTFLSRTLGGAASVTPADTSH